MELDVYGRQPNESPEAWAACAVYLELEPHNRSRYAVWGRLGGGTSLAKIEKWSSEFRWVERSRIYDSKMANAHLEGRMAAQRRMAEKWEERRLEAAESNWDHAQRLADKAREMLAAPLYEQVEENGQIVVKPVGWAIRDAAALMKLAAELQGASIAEGLAISDDENFDPYNATAEEAAAYLKRRGIKITVSPQNALPAPEPDS